MNDNISETKQNKAELLPMSESESPKMNKFRMIIQKINRKIVMGIVIMIVVGLSAYFFKWLFIAATVGRSPISRFAVIGKLEKTSGKQALDSLITEKLIIGELDKEKIIVTKDEVNAQIKKIEDQVAAQGGTLIQAVAAQGMTMANLTDQVSMNLRIEKFLADKINVSNAEIDQYIKDNKLTVPKGQEAQYNDQISNQLKSGKFNKTAQDWVSSLRSRASINYFVNY